MSVTSDVTGPDPISFRMEGSDPSPGAHGRQRPPARQRPELLPAWSVELVWRCEACGYLRQSAHRPGFCPACGAASERLVGRTSVEWRRLFRLGAPASEETA